MTNKLRVLTALRKVSSSLEDHLALYGTVMVMDDIGEKKLRTLLIEGCGIVDSDMEDLIKRARKYLATNEAAKLLGSAGGKKRAAKLTPQRRLEISKLANKAKKSRPH